MSVTDFATNTLTRSQAARLLGVSGEYVSHVIRLGQLPAIQTPLGKLIPADAVEDARQSREDALRDRAQVKETAIASR